MKWEISDEALCSDTSIFLRQSKSFMAWFVCFMCWIILSGRSKIGNKAYKIVYFEKYTDHDRFIIK